MQGVPQVTLRSLSLFPSEFTLLCIISGSQWKSKESWDQNWSLNHVPDTMPSRLHVARQHMLLQNTRSFSWIRGLGTTVDSGYTRAVTFLSLESSASLRIIITRARSMVAVVAVVNVWQWSDVLISDSHFCDRYCSRNGSDSATK